jgi:hypothetical protein
MEEIKIPKAWIDWLDKYLERVDKAFWWEEITEENREKIMAVAILVAYVQSLKFLNK